MQATYVACTPASARGLCVPARSHGSRTKGAAQRRSRPVSALAHPAPTSQEQEWNALRHASRGLLAGRLGMAPDTLQTVHEDKCWLASDGGDGQAGAQLGGHMLVSSAMSPDGQHVLLSIAAHIPGPDARTPVRAHWACAQHQGGRWHPPPPGWSTVPDRSYDAGWGAWQTPMELSLDGSQVQRVLLELPREGPLGHHESGIALVFKTEGDRWLKQMQMVEGGDGQDSLQLVDMFLPVAGLPTASCGDADAIETAARGYSPSPGVDSPGPAFSPHVGGASNGAHAAPHTPEGSHSSAGGAEGGAHAAAGQSPPPRIPAPVFPPVPVAGRNASPSPGPDSAPPPGLDPGTLALQKCVLLFGSTPGSPPEITVLAGADVPVSGPCEWMMKDITHQEPGATRSLMHRFNAGAELLGHVGPTLSETDRQAAIAAVAVWLRLSATRHLIWNRNYNVKPREISSAQDRLCAVAAGLWTSSDVSARPLLQLLLRSVGRGGTGDMGQRVRDEILEVQQRNHCKGGMMEEWHQKLHNNTSPDDVVICEALLAYCETLDVRSYWDVLHAGGITRERLASFDRSIRSEPHFTQGQVPGLVRDLTAYLQTLRAVHCGTDLASAAANVLGFSAQSMKGKAVSMAPVPNVASPELQQLIGAALCLQQAMSRSAARHAASPPPGSGAGAEGVLDGPTQLLCALLLQEVLLAARHVIRPAVLGGDGVCGGRHRDVLFLDLALEGAGRAAVEGCMDTLRDVAAPDSTALPAVAAAATRASASASAGGASGAEGVLAQLVDRSLDFPQAVAAVVAAGLGADVASPEQTRASVLLRATRLVVEGATLSSYPNDQLAWALKWLRAPALADNGPEAAVRERAMQALSVLDRLNRELAAQSSHLVRWLQPTAEQLGDRLGVPRTATAQFAEEVVRGTAAAPLAQVTAVLEPWLRRTTGGGEWQVVSRGTVDQGPAAGVVRHVRALVTVQHSTYAEPTVLMVDELEGHEDLPDGCVAVLSLKGRCPDVLSHSAVRARNMNVLLATCYSAAEGAALAGLAGQKVTCTLAGQVVKVTPQ